MVTWEYTHLSIITSGVMLCWGWQCIVISLSKPACLIERQALSSWFGWLALTLVMMLPNISPRSSITSSNFLPCKSSLNLALNVTSSTPYLRALLSLICSITKGFGSFLLCCYVHSFSRWWFSHFHSLYCVILWELYELLLQYFHGRTCSYKYTVVQFPTKDYS